MDQHEHNETSEMDMAAFAAAFGGMLPSEPVAPSASPRNDIAEKIADVKRNFRILSIEYNCGVPDCPTHKGSPEEFLEHVMLTVLLTGMIPSQGDALILGAITEQMGPTGNIFGLPPA